MLILSRFIGQSFHVYLENGETITIKLLDSQCSPYGRSSIIGIEAPKKYNIVRTELLRRNGLPVPGEDGGHHMIDDDDEAYEEDEYSV